MRRLAPPAVLLLAVCCSPLFGHAQTARTIAETTFPSVVLLVMQDANGQTISLGSGFFVESDVVATNLHVIEKASQGYAKIVGQNKKYEVVGCVGLDVARDLVLLKLREATAPLLRLGDSNEVAIGDQVYVVGNPRGLEGTFSSGIVSGVRRLGGDSLLQITAPISPGSSGGPVLDSFGRVIGIAVGAFETGENLNFAVPVSYLRLLMEKKTPVKPLPVGTVSSQKRTILDQGDKGVVGTHFSWGDETWDGIGFTFSIRNRLRDPIKNVKYLVIFYDRDNQPIEVYDGSYSGRAYPRTILPGLAGRATCSVDESVRPLTKRVKIRILDFEFAE